MSESKITVLVVDDQYDVARMCSLTLEEAGYAVVIATSGLEALGILEDQEIDIVLCDVNMPGMSGMDLLRRVRRDGAGPDVVLMTGYGSVPAAVEAIRAGAHDYILKPFDGEELTVTIRRLADMRALRVENRRLRIQLDAENTVSGMVGNSPVMLEVAETILKVAGRPQPVLISGETGTGKEMAARAIHRQGPNKDLPFVAVDCGALSEGLIESELFGHLRGSFTGAVADRPGLLAAAANGTLFLDEIGELPLGSQARLFRLLQQREYRPVGDDTVRGFAGRIIAATNQDLAALVKAGAFRQELYFRLNVHRVHIPPLRARASDIALLVKYFIDKHSEGQVLTISPEALQMLVAYSWPGNVRELDNCILTMCANCDERVLDAADIPADLRNAFRAETARVTPLEDAERETLVRMLESTGGNVSEAARRLGISKATMYRKMARYGNSERDVAGQ